MKKVIIAEKQQLGTAVHIVARQYQTAKDFVLDAGLPLVVEKEGVFLGHELDVFNIEV